MEESVVAGVVTFNPEILLLRKNLEATSKIVDEIIIVDNGSDNIADIRKLKDNFNSKLVIKENGKNLGIAAALNEIMAEAESLQYNWVLTLDQDSIMPEDIISDNKDALKLTDVAIIAAVVDDRNVEHKPLERSNTDHFTAIKECITSASLTNVPIWKKIGGFDNNMFIDYVDIEYCMRARAYGFRILRNNQVKFSHTIGDISEKKLFGKWITIRNHSAFRKYYQIRNFFYVSKKFYGWVVPKVWYNVATAYFKVIVYEKDKSEKVKQMNAGIHDGLHTRVKKLVIK